MLDILSNNQTKILENKNETSSFNSILKIQFCQLSGGAYFSDTGRCYVYYKKDVTTVTWDDARTECKNKGGDLATIANQDTHDFLVSFVNIQNSYCWIGAERNSGVWSWADGTPWTEFVKWQSGEPNNSGDVGVYLSKDYKWIDYSKVYSTYYLCEF